MAKKLAGWVQALAHQKRPVFLFLTLGGAGAKRKRRSDILSTAIDRAHLDLSAPWKCYEYVKKKCDFDPEMTQKKVTLGHFGSFCPASRHSSEAHDLNIAEITYISILNMFCNCALGFSVDVARKSFNWISSKRERKQVVLEGSRWQKVWSQIKREAAGRERRE